MDWSIWGPPIAVLTLGAIAGVVLATRGASKRETGGRPEDLEARKDALLDTLRDLESDKAKLDEEEFIQRREALVGEAAEVLRKMDQGDARELETPIPKPQGARSSALPITLGVILFFGLAAVLLQQAVAPRGENGSMTGNSQSGGGGDMSASLPAEVREALAKLESDPQDLEAVNFLTRYALQTQQLELAFRYLDTARAIDPEDPSVLTHLAVLRLQIGRLDEAEEGLAAALAKKPGDAYARVWLSIVKIRKGQVDLGRAMLNELVDDDSAPAEERAAAVSILSQLDSPPAPASSDPGTSEEPAGDAAFSGLVTGEVEPGGVLFVYARRSEVAAGPPLAAKRIPTWNLPQEFTLTEKDLIFGGDWPDQVWISAKVSRAGDPMKKSPDDVVSTVLGPLLPGGDEAIELKLSGAATTP